MTKPTKYRPNVAGVIINTKGRILICERFDIEGSWQLPQGGVDEGESLEAAFLREMREEIGTSELKIIGKLERPIKYDWPEKLHSRGYLGQEQHYFLAELIDLDSICLVPIRGEQEFSSYRWVGLRELKESVSGFKKEAYLDALDQLVNKFSDISFVE